jgi:hypothetical protein
MKPETLVAVNDKHTYYRMQKTKTPTQKNKPAKTHTYTYIKT